MDKSNKLGLQRIFQDSKPLRIVIQTTCSSLVAHLILLMEFKPINHTEEIFGLLNYIQDLHEVNLLFLVNSTIVDTIINGIL